ncbi:hypothetical protein WICPIJ_001019 [Wickerhamomyces pijperi]|uniref:G-protein coupled receptors family 2 profile 2 domain-containing protein n=1 Tax=Wickerhamomyces pijperi TaxID=599730 RepID=A0A9P8TR57_WICPI|nr:hypothetical protein WICPIJ_001019 [Wickerhamomyces pijperi]
MSLFSAIKNLLLQFVLGFFMNLHCQYLDVGSSIEASKDRSLPSSENIFLVYKHSQLSRFANHRTSGQFEELNPYIKCSFTDQNINTKANCQCINNDETFDVGFDIEALDVSDSPWFQYVVEEPGFYCASTTPFENTKLKFHVKGNTLGSFIFSTSFKASLLTIIPIILAVALGVDASIIRWFVVMLVYSNCKNLSVRLSEYFSSSIFNILAIALETYSPVLLFRVIFNALRRKVFLKFHQGDNFNIKRQVLIILFACFQLIINFNKYFQPLNYYILGMGATDRYWSRYVLVILTVMLSLVYFTWFKLISKRVKVISTDYKSRGYRLTCLILLWSPVVYYSVTLLVALSSWHRDISIIDTFVDDGLSKFSLMFKDLFNASLMTVIVVVHWLSSYY